MKEIWKPIVEYEGYYEVSNLGRVKRIKAARHTRIGKIIKPLLNKSKGRFQLALHNGTGKQRVFMVHKLVGLAFLGKRPNNYHIDHINGNKTDNRASNLRYCTAGENIRNCHKMGLHKTVKGQNHTLAKLNNKDVLNIRTLAKEGWSSSKISVIYKVNPRHIRYIVARHFWRHI